MTTISVDMGMDDGTVYLLDGVSYRVRPRFYLASCDACGWIGSSEECGVDAWGDDSDVYCPKCQAPGADMGTVAVAADAAERKATIENRNKE